MESGRSIFKNIALPLGIVVFGVLCTLVLYIQLLGDRRSRIDAEFRFDAAQRAEIIEDSFSGLVEKLEAVGRFFDGSDTIERNTFARFAAPWVTAGEFSAILWVAPGGQAEWIYPDRPFSLEIVYKIPANDTGSNFEEILSNQAVKDAVVRSAIRGRTAASTLFELSQDETRGSPQPLAVVCRPVFNVDDDLGHHRFGVIIGLVSLHDIAVNAIAVTPPSGLPTRIRDESGSTDGIYYNYIARIGKAISAGKPFSKLLYTLDLPFVDRTWRVEVRASTAYAAKRDRSVFYSSVLGAIAALALTLVAFMLARGKSLAEARVEAKSAEFEHFFTTSLDLFAVVANDGTFRRINPRWEDTLGYPPEEITGKSFVDFLHPDDASSSRKNIVELRSGAEPQTLVHRFRAKDGSYRDIEWRAIYSRDDDTIFAAARDISGRIKMEAALRASLVEKDALLKEVHHRVKNNMQVISSLLDLEVMKTDEPGFLKAAKDAQNRIRSMAMIHEQLYRQNSLTSVDLGDYVRSLGVHLMDEFASVPADLTVNIDGVNLDLDRAIPCGLIMNELLTNALKYAQSDGEELAIRVYSGREGDVCILNVEDNGPGLPAGALERSLAGETLGLGLVSGLADQIHGRLTIQSGPGARYEIRFPFPLASSSLPA
jgi:PAS domain S-box-containing protein